MTDYIYLSGSEDVRHAANEMKQASAEMQKAANEMQYTLERFIEQFREIVLNMGNTK